jgi:hypothetical protein
MFPLICVNIFIFKETYDSNKKSKIQFFFGNNLEQTIFDNSKIN